MSASYDVQITGGLLIDGTASARLRHLRPRRGGGAASAGKIRAR
ncbi:hypothetical protein [Nonomuraea sp. NPDC050202]